MEHRTDYFEIRVLLCAHAPLPALRLLDRPGITVCGVFRDTVEISAQVALLQPHVLAVCDAVPGPDALQQQVLQAVPAHPPRIIWGKDRLPEQVMEAMALPCAPLALSSLPRREECARELLRQIGMEDHLLGFEALARGAALLSACPPPSPPIQHALYPQLSALLSVSPAAVERRIRSAIESAWLHGDLQAQTALMGFSVSAERGKPTNAELLFRLAERVCQLLYTV